MKELGGRAQPRPALRDRGEKRLREEIRRGVQTIQYQVVTLMTTNGQAPFVTVFMYLNEASSPREKHDLAMIIEETLRQRYEGVKNEEGVWITPAFPKLVYVLEEDNIAEGRPYFYLTKLAAKCTAKRMVPDYVSEKVMLSLKVDANGEGHWLHAHGLPQLPHALREPRDGQAAGTTAASTRAWSPSTCPTWPCPRAVTWTSSGDLRRAPGAVPPRTHVPPQPPEGHPVRPRRPSCGSTAPWRASRRARPSTGCSTAATPPSRWATRACTSAAGT